MIVGALARPRGNVEKRYQATIIESLELLGWEVQHVFPLLTKRGGWKTGTTSSGWPDLVCHRGEWIAAIEIKVPPNTVEDAQRAWLMRFERAHCPAWVLRPDDPWELVADWFAHPWDAPVAYGWEPLPEGHPLYPFQPTRRSR